MRPGTWLLSSAGVILLAACFSDPPSSGSGGEEETTDAAESSGGLDCAGNPGGDAVEDECGVCDGPGGPCVGCTIPAASNYAPLATLDDDSCTCNAAGGGDLDQAVEDSNAGGGGLDQWQSFTAGMSGGLTRVDLGVFSPLGQVASPGTLRIYEGEGTGGVELHTQDVTFEATMDDFQQFELSTPVVVQEGSVYTIRFGAPEMTIGWVFFDNEDPYAGGVSSASSEDDFLFRTLVAPCVPE